MEDYNVLILMQKDNETGFFTDTINSYVIAEGMANIHKIFAILEDDKVNVHLFITTEDVEDWEYEAIYEHYDMEIYEADVEISEVDDEYNPMWELVFEYNDDRDFMQAKINKLLATHKNQMAIVLKKIKELKANYIE